MIIATEVIFALIIALSISIIALRREGPRTGFFMLFVTIFLITLAGGLWLVPAGPYTRGLFWLPFIVVGALGSYILYLKAPRKPPQCREETLETLDRIAKSKQLEKLTYLTFDLFFWIFFALRSHIDQVFRKDLYYALRAIRKRARNRKLIHAHLQLIEIVTFIMGNVDMLLSRG